MPRKEAAPPRDFAFDFLAIVPALLEPDAATTLRHQWTVHGTVTKNGKTYALAWGGGMTGACDNRGRAVTLTAIERSRISLAVEFHEQPGWESVPKPPRPASGFPFMQG